MFKTTAGDLAARAAAYAIPAHKVDGNDVFAVREASREALEHARSGRGPVFLEFLTYRQKGHSRTDPGTYRPVEEVEEWLARDPLVRIEGLLPASRVAQIRLEVDAEIAAARSQALAAPFPTVDTLRLEDPGFGW